MTKKVSYKLEKKETFSIEGFLNIDKLPKNSIVIDVEEEGLVPIEEYLNNFKDKLIKLTIVQKDQEDLIEK